MNPVEEHRSGRPFLASIGLVVSALAYLVGAARGVSASIPNAVFVLILAVYLAVYLRQATQTVADSDTEGAP